MPNMIAPFGRMTPISATPVASPSTAEIIDASFKYVEESASKENFDVAHDIHHVARVERTAHAIASAVLEENPKASIDFLVVRLAAIFHTLIEQKFRSHANLKKIFDAQTELENFLSKYKVSNGQIQAIIKIAHDASFATERRLKASDQWSNWHETCIEFHCVVDADRLDAIGAFGIMRSCAYAGVDSIPLYVPECNDEHCESAISHFYNRMLHIKSSIKTTPGKRAAERRHKTMISFLNQVYEEYGMGDF